MKFRRQFTSKVTTTTTAISAVVFGAFVLFNFSSIFTFNIAEATGTSEPQTPSCPFNAQANRTIVTFSGEKLVSPTNFSGLDHETSRSANLSAGRYKVSLASFDGYNGRETVSQPREQWFAKLMNGNTTVAQSNPIRDLPDNVRTVFINETVNAELTLNQSVTTVIAYHAAYPDNSSPNSVIPICIAFDKIPDPVQEPQKGCIEITKEAYSSNGDRITSNMPRFTFRLDNDKTVRNDSNGKARFNDITPGAHSVTENSLSGWTMTSVSPSNGQVVVQPGAQCAQVVFKNTKNVVEQKLTVSCDANPNSVETGETVTWTADVNGGTGSYTYSWSGTDNLTGSNQTVSKSYGTTGTKTATVTVTSGNQTKTDQCTVRVTEIDYDDLNVSCYANPSNPYIGDQVTWGANASGGNGNYTYSWNGDEGLSGNSQTVYRNYNSTGTKRGTVTVTSGNQSESRQCTVRVEERNNNNLGASCYASPSNARVGDQVVWSVNAYGGNGNYSYTWNGSDNLYGSTQTVYRSYGTEGNKYASVTVYSQGQSVTQNCNVYISPTITYTPPPTYYPPTYYPPQTPPSYVYLNQVPYTGIGSTLKVVLFVLSLMAWSTFIAYMVVRAKARKNGVTVREQVTSNISENIKNLKTKLSAGDKYNFLRK